jgi:hypothetical protein
MASRVLLITPQFYGIEKILKLVLEGSGYEVVWIENKILPFDYHGTNSKFKLLRRIYCFFFSPSYKYLKREMRKIEDQKFDILFAINAYIICPYLFRKLRSKNEDIFSVLYLWDSFSMYNWSDEIIFFNKVYSFDPEDCIRHKIAYRPVFYIQGSHKTSTRTEYDLFFVGKFSPERLSVLDKVLKSANESGLICFVKIWPAYRILFHNYYVYHILRTFNLKSSWVKKYLMNYEAVDGILEREYIIQESIDYIDVQDRMLNSNVVLDFPYPNQTGYTHRLIEALANGKKVITTNAGIRNESFFNPLQIHLIDCNNPEIDGRWIKERSEFPVDKCISKLEISEWANSIINAEIA